jgi:MYXO-CTERM domain-containing protein
MWIKPLLALSLIVVSLALTFAPVIAQDTGITGGADTGATGGDTVNAAPMDTRGTATTAADDDNAPDLGWLGLIGLIGLAGLMRRGPDNRRDHVQHDRAVNR